MRVCDHPNDRILIGRVTGVATRHGSLLAGEKPEFDMATAVAELHALTTDAHMLAHGVRDRGSPCHREIRRVLEAAGADPAEMDAIEEARQPRPAFYG